MRYDPHEPATIERAAMRRQELVTHEALALACAVLSGYRWSMVLVQVKLTREEARKLDRLKRHYKTTRAGLLRQWIALDVNGETKAAKGTR